MFEKTLSKVDNAVNAFQLFNEKAGELHEGRFFKYLQDHKSIGWKIGGKMQPGVSTNWPDEEAMRSFILTLRFFIRDRDGCSFRCLNKIYPDLNIPDDIKRKFKQIHEELNSWLDSRIHVTISGVGPLTNRNVLEVFTFGRYAHADPNKKQTLEKWMASSVIGMLLTFEFICILAGFCDLIPYVVSLNTEALKYLKP